MAASNQKNCHLRMDAAALDDSYVSAGKEKRAYLGSDLGYGAVLAVLQRSRETPPNMQTHFSILVTR